VRNAAVTARSGPVECGPVRCCTAGKSWLGVSGRGEAVWVSARQARLGSAGHGSVGPGTARLGKAGMVRCVRSW
jgi:hypothetical protein